jgi:alanine racemase
LSILNVKKPTINKFDASIFNDSLKKYVAKWEIAKLCASMKINIKTTRQGENTKNNQIKCAHLIKTQQSTLSYIFSHITKTI